MLAALVKAQGRADHAIDGLRRVLSDFAGGVAQELLDAWAAFGRFSRTCPGVEPQVLLAAWGFPPQMAASITTSLASYESLKPREEQVKQLTD